MSRAVPGVMCWEVTWARARQGKVSPPFLLALGRRVCAEEQTWESQELC